MNNPSQVNDILQGSMNYRTTDRSVDIIASKPMTGFIHHSLQVMDLQACQGFCSLDTPGLRIEARDTHEQDSAERRG